jgi:hypothetical protein
VRVNADGWGGGGIGRNRVLGKHMEEEGGGASEGECQ